MPKAKWSVRCKLISTFSTFHVGEGLNLKYQFVVILNIRSLIDLFQRYAYEYIHLRALARIGRARACMRFPPCSRANDLYANPVEGESKSPKTPARLLSLSCINMSCINNFSLGTATCRNKRFRVIQISRKLACHCTYSTRETILFW